MHSLASELRDAFGYYDGDSQEWTSQEGQCAYALRTLDAPAKAGRA